MLQNHIHICAACWIYVQARGVFVCHLSPLFFLRCVNAYLNRSTNNQHIGSRFYCVSAFLRGATARARKNIDRSCAVAALGLFSLLVHIFNMYHMCVCASRGNGSLATGAQNKSPFNAHAPVPVKIAPHYTVSVLCPLICHSAAGAHANLHTHMCGATGESKFLANQEHEIVVWSLAFWID